MRGLVPRKGRTFDRKAGLLTPSNVVSLLPWTIAAVALGAWRADAQGQRLPTLELIQTVGCEACRGPELLGRIRAVAGGSGSTFAVLTVEAPFVHFWNLDAGAAVQFGREGGGPGEMLRPVGLILSSGSVQIAASARIENFEPSGKHLRSEARPRSRYAILDVFQGSPSGRWGIMKEASVRGGGRVRRLDVSTGATVEVTIPASLLEGAPTTPLGPFSNVSVAVSDDGAVAMGYGAVAYRLAILPPGGGTPILGGRQVERMVQPALSPEAAERVRQETVARLRRMNRPPSPEVIERMAADAVANRPRTVPYLSQTFDGALRFDGAGRLWARTPKGNSSGQTTFDVFDQSLRFLGEVVIPETTTYWHVGTNYVVTAGSNDASVPVVRIWRVR